MKYQILLATASFFATFSTRLATSHAQGSLQPFSAESSSSLAKVYDQLENHETRISSLEGSSMADAPSVRKSIAQNSPTTYTVQRGDSLNGIARKYKTTAQSLANANGLKNLNSLRVGQTLSIPGRVPEPPTPVVKSTPKSPAAPTAPTKASKSQTTRHTVRAGESLHGISRKYAAPYGEIIRINNITNPDKLAQGTVLLIPTGKSSSPPPVEEKSLTLKTEDMGLSPDQLHRKSEKSEKTEKSEPVTKTVTTAMTTHTIQGNDTFYSIARRYRTTANAIQRANPGVNPNALRPGQKISVPGSPSTVAKNPVQAETPAKKPAPPQEKIAQKKPAPQVEPEEEYTTTRHDFIQPIEQNGESFATADNYLAYPVASGDTWNSIASEYETTGDKLKEINNASTFDEPVPGGSVLVPRDKYLRKRVSKEMY